MKFIVFSDQHLEKRLANIPELEQDNRDLFQMVIDKAIELNVDYLISVGDLFDNNKPSSDTIKFVSSQLNRLPKGTALAIAGDHSKPVNGATWERVCGFLPINSSANDFVGVDYNDNPEEVIQNINHQLGSRKQNSVRFLFMHQQVPELWPFCEDKKKISLKDLDFSNQCESLEAVFLGDIHIRRSMKYWDVGCNKELFVGYCGSLGVTAVNETEKPGLYYYDGNTISSIDYSLPRRYVTIELDESSLETLKPAQYEEYKKDSKTPVFIVKIHDGVNLGNKLDFLYDIGYVRTSKIKKDKDGKEEFINIRSELKTTERFSVVLKDITKNMTNSKTIYDIAYNLLTEEDIKQVLDQFKDTVLVK